MERFNEDANSLFVRAYDARHGANRPSARQHRIGGHRRRYFRGDVERGTTQDGRALIGYVAGARISRRLGFHRHYRYAYHSRTGLRPLSQAHQYRAVAHSAR